MKKLVIILLSLFTIGVVMPYELFLESDVFLMIVNMLRGLLAMAVLYCFIIWGYSVFRKKTDKKYFAEGVTVVLALLISVVGKVLAIIMEVGDDGSVTVHLPENAWQSVSAMYYSVYQAIGGLSFEGLAGYDYYESWRTIVYSGTSVLAGLVAVSIITFSFSYEIYSTVSWMMTRKKGRKIYIFTAITEDSVILAHSIAAHHDEDKQKYVIIFLRTEDQEGFDSKNPLHLDIMHSGFLFRTYNPGRKDRSIPEFLRIMVRNDYCLYEKMPLSAKYALENGKAAEVHIFALDWEKGRTSENDKVVCEDVARITARIFGKKLTRRQRLKEILFSRVSEKSENIMKGDVAKAIANRSYTMGKRIANLSCKDDKEGVPAGVMCKMYDFGMVINYHFLVNEDIDTANVDSRFDNELAKFAPGGDRYEKDGRSEDLTYMGSLAKGAPYDENSENERIKEKAAFFDYYKRHFMFDAINEANMAAFSFVKKREQLVVDCPELYKKDISGKEYHALVIGFGQNGQQTMKMSYIYAAAGEHGVDRAKTVKTMFMPHENKDSAPEKTKTLQRSDLVKYSPQPFIADVYDRNASEVGGLFRMKHPSINVEMPQSEKVKEEESCTPVKVILHHGSAYSNRMLKKLDEEIGKDGKKKIKEKKIDYNIIIIALGDDDSNVNIANALLEDSKHEVLAPKEKGQEEEDKKKKEEEEDRYQVIAINLRNRLNYDRINWNASDEARFEKIKVIRFGSSEEMYSYENIVDMSMAKKWNHGYNVISPEENNSSDTTTIKSRMRTAVNNYLLGVKGDDVNAGLLYKGIREKLGDKAEAEQLWYRFRASDSYYARLSSRYACEMPVFIKSYSVAKGFCKEGGYDKLSVDALVKLGAVEHDRWVRSLVSFGFKIGKKKELYFKEHPCIRDYKYLNSQPNDMLNVLNALFIE